MLGSAKPLASLSGGLLARKGAARPAMRPQGYASLAPAAQQLEDLGWDDMGPVEEVATDHVPSPITALTPSPRGVQPREEPEPVHLQQQAIAEHFAQPEIEVEPQPTVPAEAAPQAAAPSPTGLARAAAVRRPAVSSGRKAAFTLRLDSDRHLRLRLASALTGTSSQQLVSAALDAFIETMPDVARLARQVPPSAASQD